MRYEALHTDEATLIEFGSRLAAQRIMLGWTQEKLATEAGVGKRTIERMEAGESVQLSSLIRVLRELGLLNGLEMLLPEALPRPMELLRMKGKSRKRAPRTKSDDNVKPRWTWGDAP